MERAMVSIVSDHYEGFNQAIENYSHIRGNVLAAVENIDEIKFLESSISTALSSRSLEVRTLYGKALQYDYLIKQLEKIEALRKVPHLYADAIKNHRYYEAATLLVDNWKILQEPDLKRIGALSQLRKIIRAECDNFHEVIIEVLHNIIYKKTSNHVRIEIVENGEDQLIFFEVGPPKKDVGQSNPHEKIRELVHALFVLKKKQIGITIQEIVSRVRIDIRYIIEDIIVRSQDRAKQRFSIELNRHSKLSSNAFSRLLRKIFDSCCEILNMHLHLYNTIMECLDPVNDDESFLPAQSDVGKGSLKKLHAKYSIEKIWGNICMEIQILIGIQVDIPLELLGVNKRKNKTNSKRKLFSFADSDTFKEDESHDEADLAFDYFTFNFGEDPSPMHMINIYPIAVKFNNRIADIIGIRDTGLITWLNKIIEENFLNHIKNVSVSSTNEACRPESFRATKILRSYSSEDKNRPLLHGTRKIYKMIRELHEASSAMPEVLNQLNHIMEEVLHKYYVPCADKIHQILSDTETGMLVEDDNIRSILVSNPRYMDLFYLHMRNKSANTTVGLMDEYENREENEIEGPLYIGYRRKVKDQVLGKEHLMDQSSLILLANIHDSLLWMSEKIKNLNVASSDLAIKMGRDVLPLIRRNRNHRSKNDGPKKRNKSKLSENIIELTKKFKQLSEICLIAIRTEIRLWTFCYLNMFGDNSYVFDSDFFEHDDFILDYNYNIRNAEEALQAYLPREKIKYIFRGIPKLVGNILMTSTISKILEVNENGVRKLQRDFESISKNLSNFIDYPINELNADRIKEYYSLLSKKQKELKLYIERHISERTNQYTETELYNVFQFISPNKTVDENTRRFLETQFSDITISQI
eukprot:TRINITY_DN4781_c0_g1_i1.p1 TRINITY_DN4781_c0_g1~~TRINITY_DN4781_c0_g1_i1.p1  ORF type:complete len:926 (-),score=159.90 TRINITY_DN4781_c0_g1_i1:19-2622(-)